MYPALKLREEVSPSKPKGEVRCYLFLDMEQKEKTDIFYPSPPLSIFQVRNGGSLQKKPNNNNNKVLPKFILHLVAELNPEFLCICVPPCQWAGSFSFLGSRPACPLQILAHNGSSIPVLLKVWSTNCAGSANSLLPVHCVLSNILSKHLEKFATI